MYNTLNYSKIGEIKVFKLYFIHFYFSLGQYLASTLPTTTTEQNIKIDYHYTTEADEYKIDIQRTINQRNALLDVLIHLLHGNNENGIDNQ